MYRRRWARLLLVAMLGIGGLTGAVQSPAQGAPAQQRWAICYGDQEPAAAFEPYALVVLDSHHHPPLRPLLDRGKALYGRLSLGEVEARQPWFPQVKALGLLRQENPSRPGNFTVDPRDPRWVRMVVEDLIPPILHQHFHGLFLDALDTPAALEKADPQGNTGMVSAAVKLIRTIRLHYPGVKLVMNRGQELLPQVAMEIDGVVGEAVYAAWDSKTNTALIRPDSEYWRRVAALQQARKQNPKLQVLTLDYWDATDRVGLSHIYDLQRRNGFLPYVSTVALDRIVPEPPPAATPVP